jgi:hypothetical protein
MANSTKDFLSPIILDKIPEFIKDEYPLLVSLLKSYYEWLEEDNNFLRVLLDFKEGRDVSSNNEAYINDILNHLGFLIPKTIKIEKSQLIYLLRDFYLSQGSLDSFKFLFKLFFDTDVEIHYPRTKLAICSNTIMGSFTKIYTTASNSDQPKFIQIVNNKEIYFSTSIRGLQTNTITNIEDIIQFEVNNVKYLEISIIPVDNKYLTDEVVEFKYGDVIFSEQIVPIGKINIVNPGIGYSVGDMITAYTDQSSQVLQGRYLVSRIERGSIDALSIVNPGIGYSVGDMIFTEYVKRGAGFSAEVSEVDGSGSIQRVRILNKGWGYDKLPGIIISGTSTGDSGTITGRSSTIGRILQIDPVHPLVYKTPATASVLIKSDGTDAVITVSPIDTFTELKHNLYPINGVLGRNCILTDSNLFQQFSYEVVSSVSLNNHIDISNTIHPVGYTKFNILNITTKESLDEIIAPDYQSSRIYNIFDSGDVQLSLYDWENLSFAYVFYNVDIRQYSLSINILDDHKYSLALDYLPTEYKEPVIDSAINNRFMIEAFDAEIRIT